MAITITTGTFKDITAVSKHIPELLTTIDNQALETRLNNKKALILVAYHENELVGFKIGYEQSTTQFYSWLGGVHHKSRRRGIAKKLLIQQEQWAAEQGYTHIHVKSMNRFPQMLTMLITNGYHIAGYVDKHSTMLSKIKFVKQLAK
ncbi:N-acetyltransferase [Pseudoalteromonas sp. S3785]|uniref:GNAT family N-acetyltransferase n=1 Tax=Pseudoalteromonas sp. S3785 TaxID=579545 RepID=UPI00110AA865|nr:GNAT family N-acetyltransferase [Pseudoalteromonas sp. S3785]TMO73108.1 N-acetyltransferase [Pseudoalteromonas sp. S3785]